MSTDPTAILREAITALLGLYDLGRLDDPSLRTDDITKDLLATRIPQACQTCKGEGGMWIGTSEHDWKPCPDCPTIGTLLLYGWNSYEAWHTERTHEAVYYAVERAALRQVST